MKQFETTHHVFVKNVPMHFTEENQPYWVEGWFWTKHILTIDVGATVDTDFRTIKRLPDIP
jgi:hypothetical protein